MKIKVALLTMLVIGLFALRVGAQDTKINTVSFNGFGFSYPPELASHVSIWQHPPNTTYTDADFSEPQLTEFDLYRQLPTTENAPQDVAFSIFVYDTADFNGYPEHQARLEQLKQLLNERPDLATYTTISDQNNEGLPFLPVSPALQVIRARPEYIETDSIVGIAYITIYSQEASRFMQHDAIYTFQGVSKDDNIYVALTAQLTTDVFDEITSDFDDATWFSQFFYDYLNESVQQLNEASSEHFTPQLERLDEIVQSFTLSS